MVAAGEVGPAAALRLEIDGCARDGTGRAGTPAPIPGCAPEISKPRMAAFRYWAKNQRFIRENFGAESGDGLTGTGVIAVVPDLAGNGAGKAGSADDGGAVEVRGFVAVTLPLSGTRRRPPGTIIPVALTMAS